MAKRKTPKTEKVIDLTPKAEKVTEEQLKKIQSAVDRINRKLIFFLYYITNSMSTVNLLTNSIVHSIIFVIFTYTNLSYQLRHFLFRNL